MTKPIEDKLEKLEIELSTIQNQVEGITEQLKPIKNELTLITEDIVLPVLTKCTEPTHCDESLQEEKNLLFYFMKFLNSENKLSDMAELLKYIYEISNSELLNNNPKYSKIKDHCQQYFGKKLSEETDKSNFQNINNLFSLLNKEVIEFFGLPIPLTEMDIPDDQQLIKRAEQAANIFFEEAEEEEESNQPKDFCPWPS